MPKTKEKNTVRSAASYRLEDNVQTLLNKWCAKYKTRAELAKAVGITAPSLTNALKGNPQLDTIQKIADALGVSVASLFEEKKKQTGIDGYISVNGAITHFHSEEELQNALVNERIQVTRKK